jgi:nucleolar GTP-binding protein
LQYITYKHIKERFGDRLWLDVISKSDLLDKKTSSEFDDADDEVGRYRRFGPECAIRVSVQGQVGVKELKEKVHQLLTSQMSRIKAGTIYQETQRTDDNAPGQT